MTFPNFKGKHSKDSMIEPDAFLKYCKKTDTCPSFSVPKGVIICYNRKLMEYIANNHSVEKVKFFDTDFYLLNDANKKIGIVGNFGIGAPAAGIVLEELIAFGVNNFVSMGTAGSLQKSLLIGDVVVCDKAVRDEGTSHHYVKRSKFAYPSEMITNKIKQSLDKLSIPYIVGSSWTIDAPYRETVAEARKYQKEGVLTVEMEASALFAIAEYRKIKLGALFTISDSLADLEWSPDFHSKQTREGLENLYKVAVNTLK